MSRTVRPVIEIVTDNRYLKAGLLALLEEMADREDVRTKGGTPLQIVLIDAGRLEAYRVAEAWPSLVRQVRLADRYAFVSFSDACFDDVPHLPMNGPLGTVRAGLTRLIISLMTSPRMRRPTLFGRLNATEKQVMLFLLREYSVQDIHQTLQMNKKRIYNSRAWLMKKYKLDSPRALCDMLKLYDFICRMNASLPRLPPCTMLFKIMTGK